MSRLIAQRAAHPSGSQAADGSALALPSLVLSADSVSAGLPVYLSQNGAVVPTADEAAFQLNFRVTQPSAAEANTAVGKVARLWAVLSWPGAAPLARAAGSYEITYCYPLP